MKIFSNFLHNKVFFELFAEFWFNAQFGNVVWPADCWTEKYNRAFSIVNIDCESDFMIVTDFNRNKQVLAYFSNIENSKIDYLEKICSTLPHYSELKGRGQWNPFQKTKGLSAVPLSNLYYLLWLGNGLSSNFLSFLLILKYVILKRKSLFVISLAVIRCR